MSTQLFSAVEAFSGFFNGVRRTLNASVKVMGNAVLGPRQMQALDVLLTQLLPIVQAEAKGVSQISLVASLQLVMKHNDSQMPPFLGRAWSLDEFANEAELLDDAYHYMRYADASYGWKGALFFNVFRMRPPEEGVARSEHLSGVLQSAIRGDHASFCHLTHVQQGDILYESPAGVYGVPKHWLVADHKRKQFVLCVRGTLSVSDALTDAVAHTIYFVDGIEAHEGIAAAAHALYASLFSTDGMYLLHHLESKPDYGLVVCGHSLGGGVAVLLTTLLCYHREQQLQALGKQRADQVPFYNVKIQCFAYGPPPVLSPLSAVPKDALDNTYVFVNGEDPVPRLSLRSVREMVVLLRRLIDVEPSLLRRWFGYSGNLDRLRQIQDTVDLQHLQEDTKESEQEVQLAEHESSDALSPSAQGALDASRELANSSDERDTEMLKDPQQQLHGSVDSICSNLEAKPNNFKHEEVLVESPIHGSRLIYTGQPKDAPISPSKSCEDEIGGDDERKGVEGNCSFTSEGQINFGADTADEQDTVDEHDTVSTRRSSASTAPDEAVIAVFAPSTPLTIPGRIVYLKSVPSQPEAWYSRLFGTEDGSSSEASSDTEPKASAHNIQHSSSDTVKAGINDCVDTVQSVHSSQGSRSISTWFGSNFFSAVSSTARSSSDDISTEFSSCTTQTSHWSMFTRASRTNSQDAVGSLESNSHANHQPELQNGIDLANTPASRTATVTSDQESGVAAKFFGSARQAFAKLPSLVRSAGNAQPVSDIGCHDAKFSTAQRSGLKKPDEEAEDGTKSGAEHTDDSGPTQSSQRDEFLEEAGILTASFISSRRTTREEQESTLPPENFACYISTVTDTDKLHVSDAKADDFRDLIMRTSAVAEHLPDAYLLVLRELANASANAQSARERGNLVPCSSRKPNEDSKE